MLTVLLVVHIFITIALVALVLLQRSSSDGVSTLTGGGGSFISGRTSANILTKATAVLATVFIANALIMATIISRSPHEGIVPAMSGAIPGAPPSPSELPPASAPETEPSKPSVPIVE